MRVLVGTGCLSASVALVVAGCTYDVPDVVTGGGGGGGGDPVACEQSFAARGVAFDGETWLLRDPLEGEMNTRSYALSYWYRIVVQDPQQAIAHMDVFSSANLVSQTYFESGLYLGRVSRATDDGGTKQSFFSNGPVATFDQDTKATSWHHVLFLSDMDGLQVFHDGVVVKGDVEDNGGELDFTANGGWGVGATGDGSSPLFGELAELYLALDATFTDGEAALSSFRTSSGTPADLGCDGSRPTGSRPIVYLTHREGDASEFAQNRGSGGGFAIQGTLTSGTIVTPP